ncbi:WYL domain-containing protein [Marinobacter shengliensis]|uniref:WYL domain-containing protein n=1 Tax=Marinobacter shengliensis TaxID=1389223 RepID=UPI001E55DBF6|nr:WYL domain-containing protein [Marinobacter shengliensis]MCD1631376.1 WYL domain-containing protein [Marinobacter shengliensis]
MDVLQQLEEAIETGEVLTIVYNGGSQPGATRKISPIKIEGAKVRARCFSTNAVKLFNLEKVVIPDGEDATALTEISQAKEALSDLTSFSPDFS